MRPPLPRRRPWRPAVAPVVALGFLVGSASVALASFGGGTAVGSNHFTTGVLQPPSGLSLTATCSGGSTGGVPTFVAGTTASGYGTTLTINRPAATAVGDLLLAQLAVDDATAVSASGWTLIQAVKDTNEGFWAASLYRVAGASEPASYAFTFAPGAAGESAGGIGAYRGVDAGDPVDAFGANITTWPPGSNTVIAPSITTTVANTRLVGFYGRDGGAQISPPASLTSRWHVEVSSPADAAAASGDQAWPTAGATGTRVATAGGSANNGIGQSIALTPVTTAGTAGVDVAWSATGSAFADGYRLERWRNGLLDAEQAIAGAGTVAVADTALLASTTYEYRLYAEYENWTSAVVSAQVTTAC